MLSGFNPPLDETQWIIQIRRMVEEEMEEGEDLTASIAGVPKPLLSSKPDAYIPQFIALGPYHHHREELHEMGRYKLYVAKKIRTRLPNGIGFQQVIDIFSKFENRIRAHYHRYLPFSSETLAWMMAVDASFLLEFLQLCTADEPHIPLKFPSRVPPSLHPASRTSTNDMLRRDIIMLENQIPLFLLLMILELQLSSLQLAEEALRPMLIGFLNDLSPFEMVTNFQSIDTSRHSHLLDLLYHLIVPTPSDEELLIDPIEIDERNGTQSHEKCNYIKHCAFATRNFVMARTKTLVAVIIKFITKVPWAVLTSLPAFSVLKQPVEHLFSQMGTGNKSSNATVSRGPSIEEIAIPSVTELARVGIKFEPTNGDMSSVAFCTNTATLRLPKISLDVNSEVVIRNLVAYEAAIRSGPLIFTRYVELMNGIIDTAEDARLLRERGVVVNQLRSDGEVAELWNGMSRSVRLTRVRALDEVIEGVNVYYDGRWRVKVGRFVKKYVVSSWETWCVVIVFLLLLLVSLQAFGAMLGFGFWINRRTFRP